MDTAYDHIQEEAFRPEAASEKKVDEPQQGNLNTEFQEAYKSFSASPWGTRLGGFFGSVKKQGEGLYEGARQEAAIAGEEALKGFTDLKATLVSRARSLSTTESPSSSPSVPPVNPDQGNKEEHEAAEKERSESDALRESEGLISRFRTEAAKRLKDIEKAEDAADEALLRFGTNIRNFLRDAVNVAPPTNETDPDGKSKVLFESKGQDGKRVIHPTRFDAQLHAVHSSLDSFAKNPESDEYEKWVSNFNVEQKTDDIAADLDKYEELRRSMEKLVPEQVEYNQFWTRYYFLRMVIESEELRRKELLKGATLSSVEEEVGWDEESDSEPSTPQPPKSPVTGPTPNAHLPGMSSSAMTIGPTTSTPSTDGESLLPPIEARKSQDLHSQPDSDASYDLISGATSRAPGSPRDEKKKVDETVAPEIDEEDWE